MIDWATLLAVLAILIEKARLICMEEDSRQPMDGPTSLGVVEAQAGLLTVPPDGQLLYKMIKVEDLLRSITGSYLYFNRVDAYRDFPSADPNDGQQLPGDQPGNVATTFAKAPTFSAADYYNRSRARTYACCFSLENSSYIWKNYANGSAKGKICVVFDFAKLRARINKTLAQGNSALEYNGVQCHQIFSVIYGLVEYVAWDVHRANTERLPNPITYTYLKSDTYRDEKELRISMSALGIGQFALNDGSKIEFPPSLHAGFDFKASFADGTINQILFSQDCDMDFLRVELDKLRIAAVENGARTAG